MSETRAMSHDDTNWEYYRGVKIGTEMASARIAELEAELGEITRRAVDDDAHDAIDASARMDEREATLALLDGMPDALASDIAATIRAMDEEPLPNRIAELEAELKMARLLFGKAVVRHTNKDPDDLWDALMDEIRARSAP